MSLRLPQSSYSVIVGCVTALLTPGMVMGAPVVIHTGDAVEMTGGTYQFDSLTIEPGGFLAFTGSTTLNVTGDVIIGHDTVSVTYEDPDTHQIITRTEDRYGQLYVELALTGLPLSLSQGAPGAPGADGTNGSGGTLFPLASTPGGPGGNGGSGASLSYSIVGNGNLGLNINGGGAVTIDGIIHQEVFLLPDNHPAASGGPGGVGGHGGNGDTSLDPNAKGDGSAAGSGGHGGSGGSGASTKPFHIAINAATDVSVGPTGQLFNVNDFGGGANGGRGGDGGQGGSGTFHAAPGPDGARGDGGRGGDGGQGGAGAATGDIFIQAPSIAFAGSVYQPGGSGGSGGHGGNGGPIGVTGGTIGRTGDGGAGGSGGPGGDGGNLVFRAGTVAFTSAPETIYQPGGAGGQGNLGGFVASGGIPGVPGQNNLPGFDGSVSTHLVGQSFGVGNGDFSDGLALYRRSGGGSTQIVDVAGNAVADVMTDAGGGPTTLTQLVTTQGNSPLRLAFDYRFLTNAGIFQVLLDNTLLATLPAVQLADFSHFDLVLTDPALRGLDVADLNLRLLPGSIAEVQLDNVVFQPAVALAGDYNNNGIVDAADYVVWRKGLGTTYTPSDYNVWRAHFGQTAGSGAGSIATAAVPEPPSAAIMLFFAAAGWCLRRRRSA